MLLLLPDPTVNPPQTPAPTGHGDLLFPSVDNQWSCLCLCRIYFPPDSTPPNELDLLLLLSSARLQIIDYHPNPHGSLQKQLHSNMMRLFKTSSVWRERSISSFAGKNTQMTSLETHHNLPNTGYKLFLARKNLSAVYTRARSLCGHQWRSRRREHCEAASWPCDDSESQSSFTCQRVLSNQVFNGKHVKTAH